MKSKKGLLISIFSLIAMLACLMCLASCGGTGCSHSFGEWSTISTPSCTQDGERERCCEKCGTTETEKISALGHSYVLEVANDKTMKSPANEIDAAVYYKSCACGSVSENDTFEYGGNLNHTHSFTEEKIKAEAIINEHAQMIGWTNFSFKSEFYNDITNDIEGALRFNDFMTQYALK